jgi:hypothetical protein
MANQVLSRPMFKQSQTANPVAPTVGGIGGMTTPDQNAQALKNMFAPTVPAARPTQSFPVPQAMYKRGGEVIDGVAHFAEGDEVVAPQSLIPQRTYGGTSPDPADTRSYRERYGLPALSQFQRDVGAGLDKIGGKIKEAFTGTEPTQAEIDAAKARAQPGMDALEDLKTRTNAAEEARKEIQRRNAAAPASPSYLRSSDPATFEAETRAREEHDAQTLAQAQGAVPAARPNPVTEQEATVERLRAATRAALAAPVTGASFMEEAASSPGLNRVTTSPMAPALSPPVTPPALPPVANGQELQLQSIKARREQSEKDREQNKWMGLLSAGLGMMAGKDKNAFANIGAGGQQGIATFSSLEKARREDEATRRHEDIQMAQLAQQKTLSENQLRQQKELTLAQLAKDPETVRTYAALGGWKAGDPPEKFQEAVLAGALRVKEPDRIKALQDYITASQNPMSGITPEKARQAQEELLRLGLGQSGQPAMAAPRGTVLDLNGKPVAGR